MSATMFTIALPLPTMHHRRQPGRTGWSLEEP